MKAAGLKDVFDAKYYADQYPDLKAAFGYDEKALFQHFMNNGLKEGRNMSPILNVQAYRESYEDLDKAFGDNWDAYVEHYFTFGVNERRQEGVLFDPLEYADSYGDIKAAFGNDINAIVRHYLNFGIDENRTEGTAGFYKDLAVKQETEERIAWEEAEREAEEANKAAIVIEEQYREKAREMYEKTKSFSADYWVSVNYDKYLLSGKEEDRQMFLACYELQKKENPQILTSVFTNSVKIQIEKARSNYSDRFIPDSVLENL